MMTEEEIREHLDSHPPEKRKATALALSAKKWHPKNPKRGKGECALCVEYRYNCSACPLVLAGELECLDRDSLWWKADTGRRGPAADALYAVLVRLLEQEATP